jgi:hypothetical protein
MAAFFLVMLLKNSPSSTWVHSLFSFHFNILSGLLNWLCIYVLDIVTRLANLLVASRV